MRLRGRTRIARDQWVQERFHLWGGPADFTGAKRATAKAALAATLLSAILKPVPLDPLTVADGEDFLDAIEQQPNVPAPIKDGLRDIY